MNDYGAERNARRVKREGYESIARMTGTVEEPEPLLKLEDFFRPAPAPLGLRIVSHDLMRDHLQMFRLRGEVVAICGIDEVPNASYDEIVVSPSRYDEIVRALPAKPAA